MCAAEKNLWRLHRTLSGTQDWSEKGGAETTTGFGRGVGLRQEWDAVVAVEWSSDEGKPDPSFLGPVDRS